MAIIIEEEKKKGGSVIATAGWIVVAILAAVGAYYLFIVTPEPVIVTPPASFASLQPISHIAVMPQDVASTAEFQALHSAVPPVATGTVAIGRPNPFIP